MWLWLILVRNFTFFPVAPFTMAPAVCKYLRKMGINEVMSDEKCLILWPSIRIYKKIDQVFFFFTTEFFINLKQTDHNLATRWPYCVRIWSKAIILTQIARLHFLFLETKYLSSQKNYLLLCTLFLIPEDVPTGKKNLCTGIIFSVAKQKEEKLLKKSLHCRFVAAKRIRGRKKKEVREKINS